MEHGTICYVFRAMCSMIVGHERQRDFLKGYVKAKRIPHALLFSGEEGLGKKKVALEFLKLLNCQEDDFSKKPCGTCLSCKAIEKRTHPDFFLLVPGKSTISILQIRELSKNFALKPSFFWKTAILDQAHLMTREAQNCLLKTLEEPLGQSCLILISEHPSSLLKTITSRVQELKFFPVKRERILNYLAEKDISRKKAEEVVNLSFERPGKAIEFIFSPEKFKESKSRIQDLLSILKNDLAFRFNYAKVLSSDYDLKELFDTWLKYLRNLLILKIEEGDLEGAKQTKSIIEEVVETQFLISTKNINKRLALENLFLKI